MGLVQRVLGGWGVKDEVVRVLAREKDGRPGQHSRCRLGRRRLDLAQRVTVSYVAVKGCSKGMDCPSTGREEGKESELGRLWNRLGQEGWTEPRFHRAWEPAQRRSGPEPGRVCSVSLSSLV